MQQQGRTTCIDFIIIIIIIIIMATTGCSLFFTVVLRSAVDLICALQSKYEKSYEGNKNILGFDQYEHSKHDT